MQNYTVLTSSKHSFRLLDASLKKCWTSSKNIHPSLRIYNVNSWRLHSATVSYCTTRHDLGAVQHTSYHETWCILDYHVQEGMYVCLRGALEAEKKCYCHHHKFPYLRGPQEEIRHWRHGCIHPWAREQATTAISSVPEDWNILSSPF